MREFQIFAVCTSDPVEPNHGRVPVFTVPAVVRHSLTALGNVFGVRIALNL